MMQAAAARRREKEENTEKGNDLEASPVKTVLGTLTQASQQNRSPQTKTHRNKIVPRKPKSVEDVPFRRQDRRILNARNRRIMDRKLIVCILLTGILLCLLGAACIGILVQYGDDLYIQPLIIIGPVLLGGGIITWCCSIEICIRLHRSKKRIADDPELDDLVNPHEVKHWMDPDIIPFGWGLYEDGEEPGKPDKAVPNQLVGGRLESEGSSSSSHVALQLEDTLADYPHRYVTNYGGGGSGEPVLG